MREFREFGHKLIDWVADYLESPERYPVLSTVQPNDIIDGLPAHGPEQGETLDHIFEDFERIILPGITHWNHPRFLAFFANTSSPPAVLAELLAAALNANGFIWKVSPAVTELEVVTLRWLLQWFGLPEDWFGMILDTASTATLHAIAAARAAMAPETRDIGAPNDLVLYTSDQAHSSVEKGAMALGLGRRNVRSIATDAEFRMRPELLAEAIAEDRAVGLRPFCVVATVGTTSTTSIDPIPAIADIVEREGLWLHVDAAYAGSAAIVPEFRHILNGAERADSLVVNPHKWFFTPFDLSAFYTRRPDILRRAFSLVPEYLRTAQDGRAVNYMDYGVPLGRRFRALKLWFVMRYFGRERLAETIRSQIAWAQELAAAVDADPQFERTAPSPFSVVCFRYKGTDDENRRLLETVNASGEFFLSHTVLRGRYTLHLAIGNMGTTREHVMRAWEMVRSAAR